MSISGTPIPPSTPGPGSGRKRAYIVISLCFLAVVAYRAATRIFTPEEPAPALVKTQVNLYDRTRLGLNTAPPLGPAWHGLQADALSLMVEETYPQLKKDQAPQQVEPNSAVSSPKCA